MSTEEQEIEIERIKQRLIGLIEERFARREDLIYFSTLGNQLGEDRITLEKLTRKKLGQFIQDDLKEYKVNATGSHNNVFYLTRKGQTDVPILTPIPRYASRFWTAFAKPLEDGETTRFLNISTLHFGPDEERLKQDDDSRILPIDPRFISTEGESIGNREIAQRISEWLDHHGLLKDRFLTKTKASEKIEDSLMSDIINTLNPEQLKRVSLPLDVVKTLLARRR